MEIVHDGRKVDTAGPRCLQLDFSIVIEDELAQAGYSCRIPADTETA